MTVKEGDGEKQERKLGLVILQSHGDDKRGILILFVVHVLCHRISIEDPFIPAIDGRLDTLTLSGCSLSKKVVERIFFCNCTLFGVLVLFAP